MRLSAKTEYACKALLELALYWPDQKPIQITAISKSQHIPLKFLTQILLQLKHGGLVQSFRGKSGGYVLAKSPHNISLHEIFLTTSDERILPGSKKPQNNQETALGLIWEECYREFVAHLKTVSLQHILSKEKDLKKTPLYSI